MLDEYLYSQQHKRRRARRWDIKAAIGPLLCGLARPIGKLAPRPLGRVAPPRPSCCSPPSAPSRRSAC